MSEAKRVLSKRYGLILLLFLFANLLLYYMEQQRLFEAVSAGVRNCEAASLRPVYEQVDSFANEVKGLSFDEMKKVYSERTALQRKLSEAGEQSETEQQAEEMSNLRLSNNLLRTVMNDATGYTSAMEKVLSNVEEYLKMEAYQNTSSFGYHNVIKTRYDYKKAAKQSAAVSNEKALETVMKYRYADFFLFAFLIFLVLRLIEDKRNGCNQMVYGTPGGRGKLVAKRLLVLFLGSAISVVAIYGSTFLLAFSLYGGFGSLGNLLQSSAYFRGTLFLVSGGQFLLLYLFFHVLCSFVLALVIWGFFSVCRGGNSAVFLSFLLFSVEYLAMELIHPANRFGLLKYLNLFSLVEPGNCLIGYYNYFLFGRAVDKVQIFYGLLVVLFLIGTLAITLSEVYLHPLRGMNALEKLLNTILNKVRSLTGHYPVIVMEWHKSLVLRHGLWVVVLLGILVSSNRYIVGVTLSEQEVLYNQYLNAIDIKTAEGSEEYLEQVNNEIAELTDKIKKAEEQGNDVSLMQESLKKKRQLKADIKFGLERKEILKQERGIDIWLIQEADYNAVFGKRCIKYQNLFALFALTAVIFLQHGLFSFEKRERMEALISSTPGGRGKLYLKKLFSSLFLTAHVWAVCYLPQLKSIYDGFELHTWGAPIQSLPAFDAMSVNISIRTYLFGMLGYRLLLLLGAACIVAAVSVYTSYLGSLLLSLLLLLPHVFSLLDITVLKPISLVMTLAYNEEYLKYGFGIRSFVSGILWMLVGVIAIIAASFKVRKIDAFGKMKKYAKKGSV